jgi:hypothetical protein
MNVKEYKEQLAKAGIEEVRDHYELYSDLKSLGVVDTVILGLIEQELDRRENAWKVVTV